MRKSEKTPLPFNQFWNLFSLLVILLSLSHCSTRSAFSPSRKYSPAQLQDDYSLFRKMLEESHPGLYWYTSRDSMNYYFTRGAAQLQDSMTEPQFRKVLSYVIAKMDCGHTVVRPSKRYSKYLDTALTKVFPLSLKMWVDTATVVANLNRRDSILKRGTVIKQINKKEISVIADTLFKYISSDGYNTTHKYQTLSNRSGFGSLYTTVFGLSEKYYIDYLDNSGAQKSVIIPVYNPLADSFARAGMRRFQKLNKKERKEMMRQNARSLHIDTIMETAFIDLSSFGKGYGLKRFFKHSFKTIRHQKIENIVIDVRSNGGGNVTNSTILSKYIASHRFKIADSLYAINRRSPYGRYIQDYFFNHLFMYFMTRKKEDGHYHFGYFERHYFQPKKRNHFNGKVYILTGGNSFSATTLFIQSLKKQDNVFIVGEETGGGAYGNTAWLIPDATLPNTKIRFRLPLFRLVIDKNIPKNGHGIQPEIEVRPTVNAIKNGADFKMDKVMELIKADSVRHKPL